MITITEYTVEPINDPTGILVGDRYEFFLHIDVPEDDELYNENGLKIKVIYVVNQNEAKIGQYYLMENSTDKILDFALDEDEEDLINSFCKKHVPSDE